jgi:hypothetical protein
LLGLENFLVLTELLPLNKTFLLIQVLMKIFPIEKMKNIFQAGDKNNLCLPSECLIGIRTL